MRKPYVVLQDLLKNTDENNVDVFDIIGYLKEDCDINTKHQPI